MTGYRVTAGFPGFSQGHAQISSLLANCFFRRDKTRGGSYRLLKPVGRIRIASFANYILAKRKAEPKGGRP